MTNGMGFLNMTADERPLVFAAVIVLVDPVADVDTLDVGDNGTGEVDETFSSASCYFDFF